MAEMETTIIYKGKEAELGTPGGSALIEEMVRNSLGIPGKAGILTLANLLGITQMLRALVIGNAYRIPKFKQIADRLGSIETILIDEAADIEDKKQEKLPLGKPEKVEKELGKK